MKIQFPSFIFRLRSTFILFTVFLILGATAFVVTHLSLTTTSIQTMLNWYASQAVEIQEGNLLGAVTKVQRMKDSTDLIRGVLLLDQSLGKRGQLIEFGKKIDLSEIPAELESILVQDTGFFEQYVMMPLPKSSGKVVVFLIQSNFLRNLFLVLALGLCILFVLFRQMILANRNSEIKKRESVIKDSLNTLLNHGQTSEVLETEHPELVSWWTQKKAKFDLAQQDLADSQTQVRFAQLAAQVAHDIRSPLGALRTVIDNIKADRKVDFDGLRVATDRLDNITEDLINGRFEALSKSPHEKPVSHRPFVPTPVNDSSKLELALKNLITEKKAVYQHLSGVQFHLESPTQFYEVICFEPMELARHLSNLIDNSVEAIPLNGDVWITVKKDGGNFIFEIKDNGSGIPEAILNRFGELKNTSKSNGSGMGVHHAKLFALAHGGQFHVDSEIGRGTRIRFSLPTLNEKTILIQRDIPLAFLDDDQLAHLTWTDFLEKQNISAKGFFNFESYSEWATENPSHTLFCDHDLRSHLNGLDILEQIFQRSQGFLVTNSFDDPEVVDRARTLNIPLIPKNQLKDHRIAWL